MSRWASSAASSASSPVRHSWRLWVERLVASVVARPRASQNTSSSDPTISWRLDTIAAKF